MIHPIFPTLLGHPNLLAEHASNYGALIRQEMSEASRGIMARMIAGVVAAVSAMLALGLIGIAVMLGALHGFHWTLVIVPVVALVIAAVSGYVAARPSDFHPFSDLRSQFDADVQALHLAGERHGR
ncbi:conserved hypothetical protein [Burkholderiales bacterium 8X]|nr:conserved hypothetical protein [Burkholderiales bacterium 8X]